ncbi:MAG: DUF6263 family protein [Pirellulaceae bacterium]
MDGNRISQGLYPAPSRRNLVPHPVWGGARRGMGWPRRRILALLGILFACGAGLGPVRAETTLRWKFPPAATWKYVFQQKGRTETTGAGKPTVVVVDMSLHLTWSVESVDDAGVATLTQSIDKLTLTMEVDEQPAVSYDSSARTPTSGAPKEIANAVAGIVGAKCSVKMNTRGEVLAVEPSEALRERLAQSPGNELFSAEGLARMLRQATIPLPDMPLADGTSWKGTHESPSPLGQLVLATQYTFRGTEEREGRPVATIVSETDIALTPATGDASRSTQWQEGKQSGTLDFDVERGRFVASRFEQRIVTQRPYREMLIRVQSTTSSSMQMLAASP